MRPVIATTAPRSGHIYLVTRMTEGVLLGVSAIGVQGSVWGWQLTSDVFYEFGMIALGVGSLPMCYWLIRSKFVPAMLGAMGFVGYICLVGAMITSSFDYPTIKGDGFARWLGGGHHAYQLVYQMSRAAVVIEE